MYKKLKEQFNSLSEDEKNAIVIYKSSLSFYINELSKIDNIENLSETEIYKLIDIELFEKKYNEFVRMMNNVNNIVFRLSFFKSIDTTNLYTFINSLINTLSIIKGIEGKIILDEDINVYRGISVNEEIDDLEMAKGELISTSQDPEVTKDFLFKNKYNYLYEIKIKKGTPILVCPYSIKSHYESEVDQLLGKEPDYLIIKEDDNQKEIILYKNTLNYNINYSKFIPDENLKVISLNTEPIKKEKKLMQ